ncbi:PREDICTED: protein LURP-one-related 11 [Tarenaya hassleriana]|uniref:protein LURP-one-related 11 n=1 Tax=Tarenaya hassleriana TaxID=28532 RepID=UPI00053C5B32|nr:PREDICTED: protein LURP-one-related 11 [Tarenaya hassleriana]
MQIYKPCHDHRTKASSQNQICPEEMAKVHPQLSAAAVAGAGEEDSHVTRERESFTIWMRSLVFNGRGCTVFDAKGNIIYRVDNYDCKSCSEVYLMDLSGKVLFTLRKKRFGLFKSWEGYRSPKIEPTKLDFRMRKNLRISSSSSSTCRITAGLRRNEPCRYRIMNNNGSVLRVEDKFGRMIAEVRRKQSAKGLDLGEDVLTMDVEPQIDHSFIMALVIAYNLIKCIL